MTTNTFLSEPKGWRRSGILWRQFSRSHRIPWVTVICRKSHSHQAATRRKILTAEVTGVERRPPLDASKTNAVETGGPPPPRSEVRWFKRALWIYSWISLAILLSALQMMFTESLPPHIQTDPQAPTRVEHKLKELRKAIKTQQPYTLSIDEAELNALLRGNLPSNQSGSVHQTTSAVSASGNHPFNDPQTGEPQSRLKDLRVNLFGDLVRAYAVFNFHGLTTSVLLEGRIRANDGYVRLDPTEAQFGSLPIPQATLRELARHFFKSPNNRKAFQLSPHISSVDIRRGRLFVAFR